MILLTLVFAAASESVGAESSARGWEGIETQVDPVLDAFFLGEPVTLRVTLINTGTISAHFPTEDLDVANETVDVTIDGLDGDPFAHRTWYAGEPAGLPFDLAPSESRSFLMMLHWNAELNRYAFSGPGVHGVTVTVVNYAGGMDLRGTTTVSIVDWETDAEKDVGELMLDRRVAAVLAGIREPEAPMLERLKSAAQRETRFTPYLVEAVDRYSRSGRDFEAAVYGNYLTGPGERRRVYRESPADLKQSLELKARSRPTPWWLRPCLTVWAREGPTGDCALER